MMASITAPLGPDAASVGSPSLTSGPSLTPREWQVLRALTHLNQKEAGAALGISRSAIKGHLWNIYAKCQTTTLVGTYNVIGWLNPKLAQVDDIEARLSAIHHESGALLAELRA